MFGILCFGDSITFGRGEVPSKSWCGRLKDVVEPLGSHHGVYNLGVPGQTSTDLMQRFDTEAQGRIRIKRPEDKYLIIIAIGTNDCEFDGMPDKGKPRTTPEKFGENISALIARTKSYQADVVFLGLPPIDESRTLPFEETSFTLERVKLFNNIIKEKCEREAVEFLDVFTLMSKEDYSSLLADGLHPNSKGYDFMFKIIKNFLKEKNII
jgi:lysophospholipase L1-like esterase